VRTERV